jgi:TctA family transporter
LWRSNNNNAFYIGVVQEENFVSSMIKAEGEPLAFFSRPIAGALGALTLLVWLLPLVMRLLRRVRVPAQFAK